MIRTLTILALAGTLAVSCKPTVRTQHQNKSAKTEQTAAAEQKEAAQPKQETQAEAPAATEAKPEETTPAATEPQAAAPAPETKPEEPAAPQQPAEPAPAPDAADSLVSVSSTTQSFNILQPWEKNSPGSESGKGLYLGNNLVICSGDVAQDATYVELSLPDDSRTVTAKVLRYDADLDLALLTLEHEEDADFFQTRTALEVGEPLKIGDEAEFAGLIQGIKPVHVPLTVESADAPDMPRLHLRAARPLPDGAGQGCPVIKDGKLVAISTGYRSQNQTLGCVNAELISRFLNQQGNAGVPITGFSLIELKDPVFRKYLKIEDPKAGGLYVNKVQPTGAAAQAGIKEGDVLTAIEGIAIDNTGRCQHPLYGPLHATCLLGSYKPVGQTLKLSLLRDGQPVEVDLPLNRDAADKSLVREMAPGERPRYIMWGGLLFQPVTKNFLEAIRERAQNALPLPLAKISAQEADYRKAGVQELIAISAVIPTHATQGYDNARFCLVTKVNGKPVTDFASFAKMLDEPTPNGLVRISLNKAPYDIYLSHAAVQAGNDTIRRQAIPRLRYVGPEEQEGEAK